MTSWDTGLFESIYQGTAQESMNAENGLDRREQNIMKEFKILTAIVWKVWCKQWNWMMLDWLLQSH